MSQGAIDLAWWIGGGILALLGLALLAWALIGDRSRGRKRCPKCWYDMSAAPFRDYSEGGGRICPECGTVSLTEKCTEQTRRRWRWATFAMVMLIASAAVITWAHVQRGGIWKVLPVRALLAIIGDQGEYEWSATNLQRRAWNELEQRLNSVLLRDDDRLLIGEHAVFAQLQIPARWPKGRGVPVRLDLPVIWLRSLNDRRLTVKAVSDAGVVERYVDFEGMNRARWSNSLMEPYAGFPFGREPELVLPLLPAGDQTIRLEFSLDQQDGETRRNLWRRSRDYRVSIVPTVREAISARSGAAIDQEVRSTISLSWKDPSQPILTLQYQPNAKLQDVALGLQISILYDGKVLSSTTTIVDINEHWQGSMEVHITPPKPPKGIEFDPADPRWMFRVEGLQDLGLAAFDRPSCWVGRFDIPMSPPKNGSFSKP